MRRLLSGSFVVLAGLATAPAASSPEVGTQAEDPRLARLHEFLAKFNPLAKALAPEFLVAADTHTLDWRLLPSIAVVESGAGRDYTNNNIFGWDSCRKRFPSVRAGIHMVAARLANSKLYRDKKVPEILKTYNPRPEYAPKVLRVMRMLGPAEPVLQN